MSLVNFQGKPFNITVIQVYAPTANAKEAQVDQFYKDLEDLWEPTTTTTKDVLFFTGDWNTKVGSQEITWSNRQDRPWRTKCSRAKTKWILPRKCTSHSKYPFSTTRETTLQMDITKWSILKSNWYILCSHRWRSLYTISKNKTWSWLWLRSSASHSKTQV